MAFDFHGDRETYFNHQVMNCRDYLIPFVEKSHEVTKGTRVMEIGSGEGGVLKAFLDRGCLGVGVELDGSRHVAANKNLAAEVAEGRVHLIAKNIYDVNIEAEFPDRFDIIVLKDVIEHIHDQKKLILEMKRFLRPGGIIFFGFPPWQMPFGGHQQIIPKKYFSKIPWMHLLPDFMYRGLLKIVRLKPEQIYAMMEIKETKISIERFERIVREADYNIVLRQFYFINPIYQYKFGWKPRKQSGFISAIPWFRNFFTTCVYYSISAK